MLPATPAAFFIRPTRYVEDFKARGVDPLQILENHQHRVGPRERLLVEPVNASNVFCPTLLRRLFELRIATIVRQRQHLGNERGVLWRSKALGPVAHRACRDFVFGVVAMRKSCRTFHLTDDRKERAVGVLRRTEIAQARVRGVCASPSTKRCYRDFPIPASPERSTTWPSPLFALSQRRSSSSSSSSRPTSSVRPVAWKASKRLSTEEARSAAQALTGPAMPLRFCAPRSSSSKRFPTSFLSAFGNHDPVGPGNALQACCEVWCLANDGLLPRNPLIEQVPNNNQPGSDTDARLQGGAGLDVYLRRRPFPALHE